MNFIAAFILVNTDYNDEECFYFMIHIMQKLEWEDVLNLKKGGLNKIIKELQDRLENEIPEAYDHLMEQSQDYLVIIFIGIIIPVFTGNWPESKEITNIFSLFLFEGTDVLIDVIMRMIKI